VPAWKRILDWFATICIALAFVLVFEAEVAKPYRIPSSSMEPTLHCARPGPWCEAGFSDRVIVNRLAYRFDAPKRGQIVVFTAPAAAAADAAEEPKPRRRLALPRRRAAAKKDESKAETNAKAAARTTATKKKKTAKGAAT